MYVFEVSLLGRSFVVFRGKATGEDIWKFTRTGYWVGHLEDLEDRMLGRTFRVIRGQGPGEDFWRFSRTG